ncbi:hypothetical protein LU683_30435 [Pseudomonas asiatica]|uniref:hypothetical protein n=2 Tax=Pseudomonas TaxID=286 RepID=UPI0002A151D9|nr:MULTISPECIES: hypothetical protein [Pseudomonas]AGA72630.1 hypothetical protein B479_08590 [Pseudomonas putida HB3267]MCE0757204.1 hypothetical protein [Pseudomonas asiatica]MCE0956015.1 hypothetical protein [Pseudomonas asiatica]MCE1031060.1 hypothetical protein [Pseudomonas asiatica]MDM3874422.1 hypothetical protein [Pseudomonas asiatica]
MRERRAIYHHNGYRLRSYTELLWARVLEAAEIFYLYEPDLVRVDEGYYLPDFWLPNVGIYLEVKGKNPTEEEIQKADAVMERTGREVMFLVGRPQSDREGLMNCGMLVRGSGGWTNGICPYDLHCLVRDHVDYVMWLRISRAAKGDIMDNVRPIGDILEELFLGMADRSDMEQCLRETHAPVNAERMASLPAPSVCERGIKWFLDRQQFRLSQRGAA